MVSRLGLLLDARGPIPDDPTSDQNPAIEGNEEDMRKTAFSFTALGLLTLASPAFGGIVGGAVTGGNSGGSFVHLPVPWGSASSPPNTVGSDNFNNPNLNAFDEQQNVTLGAALTTDVGTNPIPKGTLVSSEFVFFDPGPTSTLIGYVVFDAPVLGIMTQPGTLVASNFLGAPGITYLDPAGVGLEGGDAVTIDGSNPNRIDWDTSADTPGDAVRVILQGQAVPEPASIVCLGVGLVSLLAFRRFRSR